MYNHSLNIYIVFFVEKMIIWKNMSNPIIQDTNDILWYVHLENYYTNPIIQNTNDILWYVLLEDYCTCSNLKTFHPIVSTLN